MRDSAQRELDGLEEIWDKFVKLSPPGDLIIDEKLYRQLEERYGEYFQGSMGAEAIKKLLETFDIDAEPSRCARPFAAARARRSCVPSSVSRSSPRSSSRATRRWAWSSTPFR